jgi:hypothetical protein
MDFKDVWLEEVESICLHQKGFFSEQGYEPSTNFLTCWAAVSFSKSG